MMYWQNEEDGVRSIEIIEGGKAVCIITEDENDFIFTLVGVPEGIRIAKTEVADPIAQFKDLTSFVDLIEVDIGDETHGSDSENETPYLTFIDDESKAIFQVWDVDGV